MLISRHIFINKDIRADKVRTISPEGEQLGILPLEEALSRAREQDLDLVCVSIESVPPVCRIMDYGKLKYEMNKRDRAAKLKQHVTKLKEIKIRPRIDEHDYRIKLGKAIDFLSKGFTLKITLTFRGREMARQDLGRQALQRMIDDLQEMGTIAMAPKKMGRRLTLVINPEHSQRQPNSPEKKESKSHAQTKDQ